MKRKYYTGKTGIAHLIRVLLGTNFIVYEAYDDRLWIKPDMTNAEVEAEPRYDEEFGAWTRVRAFNEADAAANAIRAHDQSREDGSYEDYKDSNPNWTWVHQGDGIWIPLDVR